MTDAIIGRQENQIEAFDWGLYAALVRKRRKDMGYKRAKDFAPIANMSRDTLYKIEQAKQVPSATVFMALNMALWGDLLPRMIADLCVRRVQGEAAETGCATIGQDAE